MKIKHTNFINNNNITRNIKTKKEYIELVIEGFNAIHTLPIIEGFFFIDFMYAAMSIMSIDTEIVNKNIAMCTLCLDGKVYYMNNIITLEELINAIEEDMLLPDSLFNQLK